MGHMMPTIPQPVRDVLAALHEKNYDASIVGGCVRDLLRGTEPKDWDITTNATPEEIQKIFPESFYENTFGTVGVKVAPFLHGGATQREHDVIEVTTYRTESAYSDARRPDAVTFVTTIAEDLARRDFTINAIALKVESGTRKKISCEFIDPYGGQKDLKKKIIRAVGDPDERFAEDALRMMRAVRFHAELGFAIEKETLTAIAQNAKNIARIAAERVRDELSRIILSDRPDDGVEMLRHTDLLKHILPELEEGVGVTQNLHHIYTVYEHNVCALNTRPSNNLSVRLAALLHDIGKPRTKRGNGKYATFYNHDHVGARMVRHALTRLRFPKDIVEHATLLVDNHLFYYNVDEVTEAAVRRIIKRVGLENIKDLLAVRVGDRLGSGVPKAMPYKLRHFEYMVEKVSKDPLSVKMLAINGSIMITDLGFTPGPKIGAILDILLGEVIDDPTKNTLEYLSQRATELQREDIVKLRAVAKRRITKEKKDEEETMKKKYWVK